jgi:hypothetical protein
MLGHFGQIGKHSQNFRKEKQKKKERKKKQRIISFVSEVRCPSLLLSPTSPNRILSNFLGKFLTLASVSRENAVKFSTMSSSEAKMRGSMYVDNANAPSTSGPPPRAPQAAPTHPNSKHRLRDHQFMLISSLRLPFFL